MNRNMKVLVCSAAVMLLVGCGLLPVNERIPKRTLGVGSGPELVFKRPVAEVIPELVGAVATGQNGRVGSELVFWSYKLRDGKEVLFHACAELDGVDCVGRSALICPSGTPLPIFSRSLPGEVRRLECKAYGQAAVGDLRPNCLDFEFETSLLAGLSSCP
jgi:hypothetical protein